ncbi:MAG: hypothetical protein WC740_15935, partial [Verrucomicrobiia bacterium]
MNTTKTDLGECNCTAELGALPDINNAATAAAERVEKDEVMKDANSQKGSTRMGVKVMNVVVRPDNCFMHLKAMCDLKVGRFVFKKVRFSRGWGQDPVIRLPWKAKRVSIPDWDYLTKLNEDIR